MSSKIDISKHRPCKGGMDWYQNFPGSSIEAWDNCPRGDWMLWIADEINVDQRMFFLTKGMIADYAIDHISDECHRAAIKGAIDYGHGVIDQCTLLQLYNAVCQSYIYSTDKFYRMSGHVARSATSFYTSDTVVVRIIELLSSSSRTSSFVDIRRQVLRQSAEICRALLTNEVIKVLNNHQNT